VLLLQRTLGLATAHDFDSALVGKHKGGTTESAVGGKHRRRRRPTTTTTTANHGYWETEDLCPGKEVPKLPQTLDGTVGKKGGKNHQCSQDFEQVGAGACATGDLTSRSSGEYTCLEGAHDGCAGEEDPLTDEDGFMMCPGPDGKLNTGDDTYLECAETDHTKQDCLDACSAATGCNGVEYKVTSHTKKSVCELHYTSIDGWKDSEWWNKDEDGSFTTLPTGVGFRKGGAGEERSMKVDDVTACQTACKDDDGCTGIEYEEPQGSVGQGDCEVQMFDYTHHVVGACYKKVDPVTEFVGYTVVGDGACATGDESTRSSGEYTCLEGAHDGCAGEEDPLTDDDGFMMCPGPDGKLNTGDDTYLECAETNHTKEDCIAACTAKSGCNGVEYKVASHTKKSVCELHYTSIDGWKDSKWFNRKLDGRFTSAPSGKGFRKTEAGSSSDPDNNVELSMSQPTLQKCQEECQKYSACTGIEYEEPQVLEGVGDCEVQFETFSHYVKGACYKKLIPE